jgi:hypothetical protein
VRSSPQSPVSRWLVDVVQAATHASPSGAAFTVVLVLHVAAVLVCMVVLVASTVAAARLITARPGPLPASVRAYFSPGVNWAGRTLYLVPVLGSVLIGLSGGRDSFVDTWVLIGLGLWTAAAGVAEAALWPAERRVQRALSAAGIGAGAGTGAGAGVGTGAGAGVGDGAAPVLDDARRACRVICASSATVFAVLVAAMVVMFARP